MNAPKCTAIDSIVFLVASPCVVSGTEAARVQPAHATPPAQAAVTRLLHRLEPDPAALWAEAEPLGRRDDGILVLDDSTLDKPNTRQIDLVSRHWSSKHRRVVRGINLLTLLWTDGEGLIPVDYRLNDKARDELTKNDLLRALLVIASSGASRPQDAAKQPPCSDTTTWRLLMQITGWSASCYVVLLMYPADSAGSIRITTEQQHPAESERDEDH